MKTNCRNGNFNSSIGYLKKVDGAWLRTAVFTAFAMIIGGVALALTQRKNSKRANYF